MKIKELKARVEAAVAMFRAEGLNVVIGLSETGGAWTVACGGDLMSLAGLAHQVEPYVQKFVDIDYSDQPSKDAAVYAKVEGGGRGGNSSGVCLWSFRSRSV